jgi:glyoxylase-like metal-dependent hydrolase (beta-lactamase superfamily II)
MSDWEVIALRYAERAGRVRADSFLMDDDHSAPHPMDYFLWLLRREGEVIVVDTGYDAEEGARRGRPILEDPRAGLARFGVAAEDVATVIVTHLHYDHAGGLHLFPNATLHIQAAEMAYATGPCMCHGALRAPFTGAHVAEAVLRLYQGRVVFHQGDGQVAEGVTVHRIGGHSRGLQAVRVRTRAGWLCLASDAAHFYENLLARKPFPIVVDVEEMLEGFERIQSLASAPGLVVPGHDPLVRSLFPRGGTEAWRLSAGPTRPLLRSAGWLE